MTTEWQECAVPLSDEEQRLKGAELAGVTKEIEKVEIEKSTTQAKYTAKLKDLRKRERELAQQVREKSEDREIACSHQADRGAGVMLTVRSDTGEVISQRPLEEHERQVSIEEVAAARGSRKS